MIKKKWLQNTKRKKANQNLRMVDLCAGTGSFSLAFESTGLVDIVYANDIDKSSKIIYDENFNHELTLGDLNEIKIEDIPAHDILTCGFPCQPFSISGKRKGFDDSRTNVLLRLFGIMRYHQPKCVVLENVKNLITHNEGKSFDTVRTNLENCGYHITYKVLNTVDITGIPQNRERIYIVGFINEDILDKFDLNFPTVEKIEFKKVLRDGEVDDKYYYNKGTKIHKIVTKEVTNPDTFYQYRRTFVRENKNEVCPTLTHNMGSGGHNVPLILDKKGARKLTPRECFNLQGFPKDHILPEELSDAKLYGLAGNAVSFPVMKLIADRLVPLIIYL